MTQQKFQVWQTLFHSSLLRRRVQGGHGDGEARQLRRLSTATPHQMEHQATTRFVLAVLKKSSYMINDKN